LSTLFAMCSFFLTVCLFCQRHFASIVDYEQAGSHFEEAPLGGHGESGKAVDGGRSALHSSSKIA